MRLEKDNKTSIYHILWIVLLIVSFLYCSILIFSPYIADDIYNSCIRGNLAEMDMSIWEYMYIQGKAWLNNGRIFPLAMLVYGFFYLASNIYVYKSVLILLALLGGVIGSKIVQIIFENKVLEIESYLLFVLLLPIYTDDVNPMWMFGGLVLFAFLIGALGILFELRYLKTGKNRYLLLSIVFIICSMLTYEIGYIYPLGFFLFDIFYLKTSGRKIKNMIFSYIPFGLLLVSNVALRHICSSSMYEGVKSNFEISKMFPTFWVQFKGALAIKWVDISTLYEEWFGSIKQVGWGLWLVLFAIITLGIICLILSEKNNENNPKGMVREKILLIIVGIGGWFIPSFVISISEKYQRDLPISNQAYLPMWFELFGLLFLLLGICATTKRIIHRLEIAILIVLAIIIMPINYNRARTLNDSLSTVYKQPREFMITISELDVWDDFGEEAEIVLDNRYVPTVSCNIFSCFNKNLKTTYWDYAVLNWEQGKKIDNQYIVKMYNADDCKIVTSSHVNNVIVSDEGELQNVYVDQVYVYIMTENDSIESYYYSESGEIFPFNLSNYLIEENELDIGTYLFILDDQIIGYDSMF